MRRRGALWRFLAVALAAVAAAAALPAAAAAHAVLESSSPAANASVPASPARIVLTFSEAPDAKLSLVKVFGADGAPVAGVTAPQPVAGDKLSLQVLPTTSLADGAYTVNYRAVSSVDGHVDSGAFAFGVGQQAGKAVVVQLVHTSAWGEALTAAGRWLLYVALALLIGAASTCVFVYAGVLPKGGVAVLRVAAAAGVVALALLTWGEKLLVGAPSLLPLFQTREGQFLLALAVAILLCVGAVVLADLWPGRWSLWIVGLTAAAAALVHVAAGHAASGSSVWLLNTLVQWVHMTAVGVWVGGLFWLLLGFRGRDHGERAAAVGVFTRIATVTLVVVLATGLVRGLEEVGSVGALFDTRYGITLLVKVVLVAGLVGLGALNHFFWVPAVRGEGGEAHERRFRLNSRGELAVVLAVLVVTAVLSGLAPAKTAAAVRSGAAAGLPGASVVVSGSDYATSVRVTLTLTPGVAGSNTYTVRVDDYDTGAPLATVVSVSLDCSLPAQPALNSETVQLRQASGGRWTGRGLDFAVAGRWQVVVSVQEQSSGTTVKLEVPVRPAAGAAPPAATAPAASPSP
jgi:copper transport protein